jgi:hypothetical protein
MSSTALEWIADPYQSEKIIESLTRDFLVLQSSIISLPTGASRYSFIVEPLSHTSVDLLEKLKKEIIKINYIALSFSFNMVGVPILTQRQYAQGLEKILMSYLGCRYSLEVGEMEHLYLDHPATLVLRPISMEGLPFYMSEEERLAFLGEDFHQLIGYDLLSPDPLVWFYFKHNEIEPGVRHITSFHGMAIFPIVPPPEEDTKTEIATFHDFFHEAEEVEDLSTIWGNWWTERDIFKQETMRFVASWRREGYIALFLEESNLEIARDLAEMWQIDYYGAFPMPDSQEEVHVFAPKKDLQSSLDLTTWFKESIRRIRLDELPLYFLGGDWTQYVEPTLEKMARLQYAARRAYRDLPNIVMKRYVEQVLCLPNLLLAAPISSLQEATLWEEYFRSYLSQTPHWQVVECPDREICQQRESVAKLQDPTLEPMFFQIPADPERYFLVLDTAAGSTTLELGGEVSSFTQANGISSRVEHEISLPGKITYQYHPDIVTAYSFYLDDEIHLVTLPLEEAPKRVLSQPKEDLLSPWGECYLKYHPESKPRREHLLSERSLKCMFITPV